MLQTGRAGAAHWVKIGENCTVSHEDISGDSRQRMIVFFNGIDPCIPF